MLEQGLQLTIKEELIELTEDPSNGSGRLDLKKLTATKRDNYRLSVGDYRIIFFTECVTIKVVKISKKSDVYSWLD